MLERKNEDMNDKQPLVSVIVPIYNVEKYLRRCVDSILSQSYQNLEVWLVDDGSPDGCPAICDEYARKDNRVKIIHKKNGGLSDARNVAIDVASGEYICFVDSDDYVASTYVETLYALIDKYQTKASIINPVAVDELGKHIPSSLTDKNTVGMQIRLLNRCSIRRNSILLPGENFIIVLSSSQVYAILRGCSLKICQPPISFSSSVIR